MNGGLVAATCGYGLMARHLLTSVGVCVLCLPVSRAVCKLDAVADEALLAHKIQHHAKRCVDAQVREKNACWLFCAKCDSSVTSDCCDDQNVRMRQMRHSGHVCRDTSAGTCLQGHVCRDMSAHAIDAFSSRQTLPCILFWAGNVEVAAPAASLDVAATRAVAVTAQVPANLRNWWSSALKNTLRYDRREALDWLGKRSM